MLLVVLEAFCKFDYKGLVVCGLCEAEGFLCGFYSVVKISRGGVSGGEGSEEVGLFIVNEFACSFCHAQCMLGVSESEFWVGQFNEREVVEDNRLVWVKL